MSEVYRTVNYRGSENFRVPGNPAPGTRRPVMPPEEFPRHEKHCDSYRRHDDKRSYDHHHHYYDLRSRYDRPSGLSKMEKRWLQKMPQAWRY